MLRWLSHPHAVFALFRFALFRFVSFRFVSLCFVSLRFISFGTRSSFLVAREPPIHPAPTFVAHPPTLLREGGEGGGKGGVRREDAPGRGKRVGEMVVPRRRWNCRAGTSESEDNGSADEAGIAEMEWRRYSR